MAHAAHSEDLGADRRAPAKSGLPPLLHGVQHEAFANLFGGKQDLQAALQAQWIWHPDYRMISSSPPGANPAAWGDRGERGTWDILGPLTQCPMLLRFGEGDDAKHVCNAPSTEVPKHGYLTPPCTVISVGSNNQWGFEHAIARALPHCRIHTLDCTIEPLVPLELRRHVSFHRICVGEEDHVWPDGKEVLSWSSVLRKLDMHVPPAMLKMDIEGFEWGVLQQIVRSRDALPFSISVELHSWTEVKQVPWYGTWRSNSFIRSWVHELQQYGGYSLVDRHDNSQCAYCTEVVFAQLTLPQPKHNFKRQERRKHARRRLHANWLNGTTTRHQATRPVRHVTRSEMQR
mmetsp:Transcript_32296/g.53396  ORF Transcript_32296/g.53396 Transcript_32296/m.53396 type:complete len:345 (-) Transcript_32296:220-1254(-)